MATKKTSPKRAAKAPSSKTASTKAKAKPASQRSTTSKTGGPSAAKPESKPAKKAAKPKKPKATTEDAGRKLALAIAAAGLEHKAINVEIIDVRGKVDYADYVIVMSGRGERQVAALAGHIEREVLKVLKVRCSGIEGLPQGAWVLMDYGDVIVHIFHEDTRGYYDVEALWLDAARVDVE